MASAVEYVNRAILTLGGQPIAVLSPEDSPLAATAIDLYTATLEQLLAEFPWRFATTRMQLSKLTTSPADTNWQYEYALPAETLRVVRTDLRDGAWMLYRDQASGYRRLYSNESVVWADIVVQGDAALFPAHFQTALVARLCAALAMPVTRRIDIMQAFKAEAEREVSKACTQDFNEMPWQELEDGNLLADARFGN